jgi:hypothetical protein
MAADGNLQKVNWLEAAAFPRWRTCANDPTPRDVSARMIHDGRFLYVQLRERMDTRVLKSIDDIERGDHFQLMVAENSSANFREMLVSPDGKHVERQTHGAGRQPTAWNSGAVVNVDRSSANEWVVRIAFPLDQLIPGGGGHKTNLFVNFARRSADRENEAIWCPNAQETESAFRLGEISLDERSPKENVAANQSEKMRREGLVGWWRFEEKDGAPLEDSSGNGHAGKLVGAIQHCEGVSGQALLLTEGKQYVDLGNSPDFDFTSSLSMEAWVNMRDNRCFPAYYPAIIGKGYSTGSYSLHVRNGNRPNCGFLWSELDGDNQRSYYQPTEAVLMDREWNHVATTYDGEVLRIYINGHEVGQGLRGRVAIQKSKDALQIGWIPGGCDQFFGAIDEVALYKRALSPSEIYAHFQEGTDAIVKSRSAKTIPIP